jgi:hypothetical protein
MQILDSHYESKKHDLIAFVRRNRKPFVEDGPHSVKEFLKITLRQDCRDL